MKIHTMTLSLLMAACFMHGAEDFIDYGPAVPMSSPRGIVSTLDGNGKRVVLVLPFDHRGAYEMLVIYADTGKTLEVPLPRSSEGDAPYSSILSRRGKYYAHLGYCFYEFDPAVMKFTAVHPNTLYTAMSMYEDDDGVIWSATYPSGGLASYDPTTKKFIDYGSLNKENWEQYPRSITGGKDKWIYFGVGNTNGQLVAFNPVTRESRPLVDNADRPNPSGGAVSRGEDGLVYGNVAGKWFRLLNGTAEKINKPTVKMIPRGITSTQNLFHGDFGDGTRVVSLSLIDRLMICEDKDKKRTTLNFDYSSDGCHIMGLAALDDGNIYGGTAFPMRFFTLNTKTNTLTSRYAVYQYNTLATHGNLLYIGAYCGGYMLKYDCRGEWQGIPKGINTKSNPAFYGNYPDVSLRPHDLAVSPDGKTVVMGGTPEYGCTGGGLAILDVTTGKVDTYPHTELALNEAPCSIAFLPSGNLLIGTTVSPGTGGERKAKECSLLEFDMKSRKRLWSSKPFPSAYCISDMLLLQDGTVLGICDSYTLFVADPTTRKVVRKDTLNLGIRAVGSQGVRALFNWNKKVLLLCNKGAAIIDTAIPNISKIMYLPGGVGGGGDISNNRLYYFRSSHVMSATLAKPELFVTPTFDFYGSFHNGTGALPEGWFINTSIDNSSQNTAIWKKEAGETPYVELSGVKTSIDLANNCRINVKPGMTVTLTAEVAGKGTGKFGIYPFNANGTSQDRVYSTGTPLTPVFKPATAVFTIPPEYPESGPTSFILIALEAPLGTNFRIRNVKATVK